MGQWKFFGSIFKNIDLTLIISRNNIGVGLNHATECSKLKT